MATPSIAMIPSGVKAGKVYSVLPTPVYGEELVVNGDFATDTDWNKGSNWSISGSKATSDASGLMQQSTSELTFGKTYKTSFEITEYTSGGVKLYSGSGSDTPSYKTSLGVHIAFFVANGNTTSFYSNSFIGSIDNVSVKEVLTANADFDFTRASTATRINSQGLIETVASNVPRLDYSNGDCPSLLLEPQSTNLITYSEDLSNMQIAFGGAISLDSSFLNPSGENGSYFIYDTDGGSQARFRVSNSGFTLGDKLSYSVFVKSDSSSSITIGGNYGSENCSFNVGTKTLTYQGTSVNSYEIINFTNGWTRYVVNTTFNNNVGTGDCFPFFTTNATLSEKIYIWGHQLEQNSYATSYIPTLTGTAQTRVAETCGGAGDSSSINSEEGVLYAETATLANDGIRMISLSSGSNNDRVAISYNTNGRLDANIISGGGFQAIFNYTGVVNPNTQNKIALKYKLNDFALWVNGVEVATDSSGITPIGLSVLNLSSASIAADPFYGNTKDLRVYNTALSDEELIYLTGTLGEDYYDNYLEMSNNLNYTIQ